MIDLSAVVAPLFFTVLGTALGVVITLVIEGSRKPDLQITVGPRPPDPKGWRFVHARVTNRGWRRGLGWMPSKHSAASCRAWISFHDKASGTELFKIDGRWATTGQPLAKVWTGKELVDVFWDSLVPAGTREDIPPDEYADLDVAVKHDGEVECYAFNNWSYAFGPKWKNPKWRLDRPAYLVIVKVASGQQVAVKRFILQNPDTSVKNFSLKALP